MISRNVVVVGIDGSEVAGAALAFAANEAHQRGARLVVAHGGSAEASRQQTEVRPFAEILCREAITKVAAMHPHVRCDIVQRSTDPSHLLVELSADADLLVVGTHRTGRLRGWVLGSVSQYVAAHAACPIVTITTAPAHDDGPVLLGASASAGGIAALRFACEEARLRGVAVRAIRSLTPENWMLTGAGYSVDPGPEGLHTAAQAELDAVLTEAKISDPDVSVTGEVGESDPFVDLLGAAEDAAMLVVGSRRGPDAAVPHLGPVAAWLLHQAGCPLAVVGQRTN
jgi:nucleotide-binding universal stress UspA family protein